MIILRNEPIMIWGGGGLGQKRGRKITALPAREKNLTATCMGGKTQLNNLEEKN